MRGRIKNKKKVKTKKKEEYIVVGWMVNEEIHYYFSFKFF